MLVNLSTLRSVNTPLGITFTKAELNAILSIYSFQVSRGKWRDYAMDFLRTMAVFSIFKNSSEQPIISIVKTPGNTSTGYIYELFFEKKRLSRSPDLVKALERLKDSI